MLKQINSTFHYFYFLTLKPNQTISNHRNQRIETKGLHFTSITSHPSSSNPNHPFSASPFRYLDIFYFQKIASRPLLPSSSPSPKKESSRHPCHRPPTTRPWPACKKKKKRRKQQHRRRSQRIDLIARSHLQPRGWLVASGKTLERA